ncbi:hypothetical protein H9639_01010 [Arthrobacter sp. Sa2CUA1]|uniref:Uncharacterized protein n=1 Tax=Arthrobacter gallicola TaxID=2762225 RepID=A0ABR8UND5_9MICC|nr:hypothetical protein [Arthrobacter gallicola]MBD7993885.1 hypothetical protein [Arthrobacter gallicola]
MFEYFWWSSAERQDLRGQDPTGQDLGKQDPTEQDLRGQYLGGQKPAVRISQLVRKTDIGWSLLRLLPSYFGRLQ